MRKIQLIYGETGDTFDQEGETLAEALERLDHDILKFYDIKQYGDEEVTIFDNTGDTLEDTIEELERTGKYEYYNFSDPECRFIIHLIS